MKSYQNISNSFLVYSFVFLTMFVFIAGIAAIFNFVDEAGKTNFLMAFTETIVYTSLGIVCLLLVAPCYRLTKSLKVLHLKSSQIDAKCLVSYNPFFIRDLLQADEEILIGNIKKVQQNQYFQRLVEFDFEKNGECHTIRSFIKPGSLELIQNS